MSGKFPFFYGIQQLLFILPLLSSLPELDGCEIYNRSLVDPLLRQTYENIPNLPR